VNVILEINCVLIEDAIYNIFPNIQNCMPKCVVYTIQIDILCISISTFKKIGSKVKC
jgi:hypothetical protein